MSERGQWRYDSIARKWLALIERRQENFIELCDTGRWRHYYSKAEFLEEMRKVLRLRDQWAALAGLPPQSEDPPVLGNVLTPHRVLPDRLVPLSVASGERAEGEADFPRMTARAGGLPAMRWPE
jgi:uncharacterized repeat protein (TIGR03809 family)